MKKKTFFLHIIFVILVGLVGLLYLKRFNLEAQTTDTEQITTFVSVGNSCPAIPANPDPVFVVESTASTATSPTTPGQAITWTTTAIDANGENYYLIICSNKTGTAVNGGAPNCGGGVNRTYATSSSTASGSPATASYTTLGTDPWENPWYAYVCDSNAINAKCCLVSADPGSAANETPFYVNHAPTFTVVNNNSPRNPGQNVTWTTTASDTDGSSTVKLLVCKTQAMVDGVCTGGAWCTSSAVASNPTCSYLIPTPTADTTYNAWVYVVDQFNTPAAGSGTKQASASNYVVSNVAPAISNVTLNGGAAIELVDSSTKAVPVTATVVDDNGCAGGEITSVNAYVYRSGIGYSNCDTAGKANNNHCYPAISCSAGTCSGTTVTYSCTANLQYYADPTDLKYVAPLEAMDFKSETWLATVKATDNNSASNNTQIVSGVNVNSLAAFSIAPAGVNYGEFDAGGTDTTLNKTIVVTPTGNCPFNVMLSGTDMCTNYPTCGTAGGKTPIAVGQQKYALATGTTYSSGIALSTTPTKANLLVAKVKNVASIPSKTLWWGIAIPTGKIMGDYSGVNTITSTAEGT